MVEISPNILIITINISGLNSSVKRQRLSNWGKINPDIYIYAASISSHKG